MDKERERKLDELIDACWAHHAWVKGLRCNCNFEHPDPNDSKRTLPNAEFDRILPENEIPILWFGDVNAYDESPRKIVTVGLNPSDGEFPEPKSSKGNIANKLFRFEDANPMSGGMMTTLDESQRERYKASLNHYFSPKEIQTKRKKKCVYTSYVWFKHWRATLEGLDASFEPRAKNYTVVHTDFITPVATTPAWTKFGAKLPCVRDAIEVKSRELKLWKQLMEILEPDLILSAVAGEMADKMATDLKTSNTEQPYFANQDKKHKWTLARTDCFGKQTLFVNVPPEFKTPFSCWSETAKLEFGKTICSKVQ